MHLRDLGRFSGPTVLLLHDSPVPAQHLKPLADALLYSHRVLLPDMPGYGDSPRSDDPLRGAQAELEGHLRAFNLRSIDVVGVGLGAYRALSLALSGAVQVRRMVLLGGFATLNSDERQRCLAHADILGCGGDLCETIISRGLPPEHRDFHPDLVERLRGWVHDVAPETWIAELHASAGCDDLRPRLGDLGASVLVLHGSEDKLVPVTRSADIAGRALHAQLETLPCGHLPLEELRDRVVPRIRGFLTF